MTRSIVVLLYLLLLLAVPANAVDEVSDIDLCRDISIIANEIMTARQMDKPMSETLPAAVDRFRDMVVGYKGEVDLEDTEEMTKAIAPLVMAAYDIPLWPIESMQRNAISTFENTVFGGCYKESLDSEE